MKTFGFIPSITSICTIKREYTDLDIEKEPMIYGGSWDWSLDNAGPITQRVMAMISESMRADLSAWSLQGYHPIIDTKSVMLMPGMYPCIGGWHCDGVIRADGQAQPDLNGISLEVPHYLYSTCSNGHCPTEFVDQTVMLDIDEEAEGSVWGKVNSEVIEKTCRVRMSEPNEVIRFTRPTIHRGTAAKVRMWRYFFRLSFYHMPARNRYRNQVQVYTDTSQGW